MIMKPIRIILKSCSHAIMCVLFLFPATLSAASEAPGQKPEPAQNIILLIGDGMSLEAIGLLRDYARIVENRRLHLEDVMDRGSLALVHAIPVDKLVIDSSAAGTALATGRKTQNGMVSVGPDGAAYPTIAEIAKRASRSVGIVTTTSLSHATPACFVAHAQERYSEAEIARQMVEASIDVMMGGGLAYWIPQGRKVSEYARLRLAAGADMESLREDNVNLLEKLSSAGYQTVHNRDELLAAQPSGKMLGLFAASHMPYALDRRPDDAANAPSLAEMTSAALQALSKNEQGFFLMVEGGRIDHAAHNHDIAAMIADALDFDEAVGVAFDFARAHPRTLLLITADHATAAPSLTARYSDADGKTLYPGDEVMRKMARQDASFEHLLFLLSKRPSPTNLRKLVFEHTAILLSQDDAEKILRAGPLTPFHVIKPRYRKFGYVVQALGRALGVEYSVAWATAEHYSEPVVLISYGAAEPPGGYLEQTDIFEIMKTAGGFN